MNNLAYSKMKATTFNSANKSRMYSTLNTGANVSNEKHQDLKSDWNAVLG